MILVRLYSEKINFVHVLKINTSHFKTLSTLVGICTYLQYLVKQTKR